MCPERKKPTRALIIRHFHQTLKQKGKNTFFEESEKNTKRKRSFLIDQNILKNVHLLLNFGRGLQKEAVGIIYAISSIEKNYQILAPILAANVLNIKRL